eukprot:TRINITY_DN4757_c0_g1_i1.p1 TRINITY_DN4757_c0_g1~~TRINITY_DN4757_c0_g1_i1.p1  ORF type:complete len:421 (-),score=87.85 TRINITY_DN4757_c0_g1_i1:80-1342(-)
MGRNVTRSEQGFLSNPFQTNQLSPVELATIRTYRYHGSDASLVKKYVLDRVYDVVTPLYPMWLAPNVITVTGGLCMLLATLLLVVPCPTLDCTDLPRLNLFLAGVLVFTYQTLDNTDGRQARRTKSSSPLGDLIDHGVDSLCLTLGAVQFVATLALGRGFLLLTAVAVAQTTFFCATWEQYFVGALNLPMINGAMEGLLSISLLHLVAGVCGQALYQPYVGHLCTIGAVVLPLFFVGNFWTVFRHVSRRKAQSSPPARNASDAVRSVRSALYYLLPHVAVLAGLYGVPMLDRSLLDGPSTIPLYLLLGCVLFSFGYANSKLTLAFLIGGPYRHAFKTHAPLVLCLVNAAIRWAFQYAPDAPLVVALRDAVGTRLPIDTLPALVAAFAVTATAYIWFVVTTTWQVCDAMGIRPFSLARRTR